MSLLLWFINTRLGQSLLLAAAIVLAAFVTYKVIDHSAFRRGELACQSSHMASEAIANQNQAKKEQAQRVDASKIASKADAAAEAVVEETTNFTHETKEVIRNVYRDPPKSQPLPGSCSRPLDQRVQARFDEAVDRANGS
jgi:hypothetical protein